MTESGLSRIQEATVKAAMLPGVQTYTDVAKKRGVVVQSVHEILNRPEVKAELIRREQERSDKAKSVIDLAARQIHRVMRLVDHLFPESPKEEQKYHIDDLAKVLIATTGVYGKFLEMREKYGIGAEVEPEPLEHVYFIKRAIRIAYQWGKNSRVVNSAAEQLRRP